MKRGLRFVAFLAAAIMIGLSVQLPANAAKAAAAPPPGWCYGDYCSGMDPHTTRHVPDGNYCDADGRTVASQGVPYTGGTETVELRWSANCQTNWARFNYNGFGYLRAIQPSTGYTQDYVANNGVYWWTKMIYSPTKCVKAVVFAGGAVETWCV